MEPKKLTLGQAIDAMIEGKVVAIGRAYYRVGHNFLHRKQFQSMHTGNFNGAKDKWEPTQISWLQLNNLQEPMYVVDNFYGDEEVE